MMLFLDTSVPEYIKMALVGQKIINTSFKSHSASENLIPEIAKFLKKMKVTFKNINKIGVVVGPGHFSRVRTGVATANALGYALNLPVVGIKQGVAENLTEVASKKGERFVNVFYDRAPNITIAKKKSLKI